jgi:threonylcarbamoyladenosine tRNA methylthiotransferase MtaB
MRSVAVYTLGCKLNQLESEAVADAFRREGFSLIPWDEGSGRETPDLLIINTCTVTSKAEQKGRRLIRKALRDYPEARVLVTGCYAQLDPAAIAALEADRAPAGGRLFVVKGDAKSVLLDLPRRIRDASDPPAALAGWCGASAARAAGGKGAFRFSPKEFSFHTRAFLKIQDGCDSHCTYCRVRLARGPSLSLGAERVLAELRELEERGCAEAVLTGVNITQYRDSGGLAELLVRLLEGTRRIALRLSSLEPDGVSGELAAAAAHRRIRPHFHLSVQSGSSAILKKMGRRYDGETVERAAALLRSVKTDPFLACDIITGFPGETEAEFERTRLLCERTGFAWIHAFPYSKRPGTPACSFQETVSERDAVRRVDMLLELARSGRRAYVQRWQGREITALVEEGKTDRAGYCRAMAENYLKLLVSYAGEAAPAPGTALRCRIGAAYDAAASCNASASCDAAAVFDAEAAELERDLCGLPLIGQGAEAVPL